MDQNAPKTVIGDDDSFVQRVWEQLEKGAATRRGITADEYVSLARVAWDRCVPDQVYRVKILIDPVVEPDLASDAPDDLRRAQLPFCILLARIRADGELVDAPSGYERPQEEGVLLRHLPVGSPRGGRVPEPSAPADYLIAFLDVLGFSDLLGRIGLDALLQSYERLLAAALGPNSESHPWSAAHTLVCGKLVRGIMWLPIKTAYFSDSLLLWVPYHPSYAEEFLRRCSAVFCASLIEGLPIRGAISTGRAVLDKEKGIYLGTALVEAVRFEEKTNWVGVSLSASWKTHEVHIPPDCVFPYEPPMKRGGALLSSGLVLDWPRVWRWMRQDSAIDYLHRLRRRDLPRKLKARYDAASSFWLHSDKNQDWCLPPGWSREVPWPSANRDPGMARKKRTPG